MAEAAVDEVLQRIAEAAHLYYRLVLVVAPSGSGKTRILQEVGERVGCERINVNLELSRGLLDLPESRRVSNVDGLMAGIVEGASGEPVLLDNIELLFDVALRQNPLLCLQRLSRSRTVVAAWSGILGSDAPDAPVLIYARAGHPEYQRCPCRDVLIVCPGMSA